MHLQFEIRRDIENHKQTCSPAVFALLYIPAKVLTQYLQIMWRGARDTAESVRFSDVNFFP